MSKCLSVRSHSGGLGKLCTFNFCLGLVGAVLGFGPVVFPLAELDMIVRASEWRRVRVLCIRPADDQQGVVVLGKWEIWCR